MHKMLFGFLSAFIIFGRVHTAAMAVTEPSFHSCENLTGNPLVQYSEGTHGVPGDSRTFTGSDEVFLVEDKFVVQCLCSNEAGGIQSNWWKFGDSLTETDVQVLVKSGWVYVPNGSLWGLDGAEYLVKNVGFSCGGRGGTDVPDDNDDDHDDDDDSSSSSSSDGRGGMVLGASTMAATGNAMIIFGMLVVGLLLLLVGGKNPVQPKK
jgi:hypothetical protein